MAPSQDGLPAALRLYSIDQAATMLHCGEWRLYQLVRDRKIPHTRIGRKLLFSEEHLVAIAKSFERPAVRK